MNTRWLCCGFAFALTTTLACGDDASVGTGDEAGTAGTETGTGGECPVGAPGCPCTAGGACDAGYECWMDTCIPEGGTTGTGDTTGDGDTGTTTTDTDTTGTDTTDTDTTGTTTGGLNCGDAVVDYDDGEQCDDGNNMDGDGCSADCMNEVGPSCGNGDLELGNGEECDDGNTADGDGCSANCQFELVGQSCGDQNLDAGEVCDDGNTQNGDSCNPTCNLGNSTSLFAGGVGVSGLVDGVGTAARFNGPGSLAVSNTHLWVGDGANNCIRQVDIASAMVTTIAGDVNGNGGDMDAPVGTDARFSQVGALATDGTTLWVVDAANHKLKAVDLSPPYAVTTVAGDGSQAVQDGVGQNASFDGMRGLTYHNGYVYILDGSAAVLRSYNVQTQEVLTLAGQVNNPGIADGLGMQAQFISPRYMASDNSGMLYIADTNGYHIRSYNIATTYVGTFAGSGVQGYADGVGTNATIHRPRGMTSDGTSIYFTEFNQHTIRQGVLASAEITTLVGQHCGGGNCNGGYTEGVGTQAQLDGPWDVVFHYPSSSLFFFDTANQVIRRIQ